MMRKLILVVMAVFVLSLAGCASSTVPASVAAKAAAAKAAEAAMTVKEETVARALAAAADKAEAAAMTAEAANAAQAAARSALKAETAAKAATAAAEKAAAAAEATELASAQPCTPSQLTVGGFGTSAAAGTQVVTIRIEDTFSLPCSLTGYPVIAFLNSAGTPLHVTVSHTGIWPPGVPRIVLPPGEAASAGFIILSSDIQQTPTPCPVATSISVAPPNMSASFKVDTAIQVLGIFLCRPGSAVDISPIVKGTLLAVSPPVTAPTG